MKKQPIPVYADALQKELVTLVSQILVIDRELDEEKEAVYQKVLGLAIVNQLLIEELEMRLALAGLPNSTANEILTIYEHLDLAGLVCYKDDWDGKISVREALRQARARNHGETPTTSQEERFRRAADKVLDLWGREKPWSVEGKIWELEFVPRSALAAAPLAPIRTPKERL